ncbi:MAG: peptidoglycan-associated lipoprotein Pal [Deltaproteobacteria bacterium]|nr:peptidoglycan-associated lipoprotein Pal [Deltaproteobacteria bacterium]
MEEAVGPSKTAATGEAAAKSSEGAVKQGDTTTEESAQRMAAEIRAFESESIYFDFDKAEIRPEARVILEKKGEWLRSNPDFSLRIEGHCDERGTNDYNLALGDRRASAAAKFLKSLGVSSDRVSVLSYGEEQPADPGHNEAAWAKNRRDEFKLVK